MPDNQPTSQSRSTPQLRCSVGTALGPRRKVTFPTQRASCVHRSWEPWSSGQPAKLPGPYFSIFLHRSERSEGMSIDIYWHQQMSLMSTVNAGCKIHWRSLVLNPPWPHLGGAQPYEKPLWLRNWSSRATHYSVHRWPDFRTQFDRKMSLMFVRCSSDVRLVSCLKHLSFSLTISSTRLSDIIWCRIRHQDLLTYLYNKISLKGHCGTGNDRVLTQGMWPEPQFECSWSCKSCKLQLIFFVNFAQRLHHSGPKLGPRAQGNFMTSHCNSLCLLHASCMPLACLLGCWR